jgi:hypothetical protein
MVRTLFFISFLLCGLWRPGHIPVGVDAGKAMLLRGTGYRA